MYDTQVHDTIRRRQIFSKPHGQTTPRVTAVECLAGFALLAMSCEDLLIYRPTRAPLPVDGVDGLAGVRLESERHEAEAARVFRPCFSVRGLDEIDALDRPTVREHGLDVLCVGEAHGAADTRNMRLCTAVCSIRIRGCVEMFASMQKLLFPC